MEREHSSAEEAAGLLRAWGGGNLSVENSEPMTYQINTGIADQVWLVPTFAAIL
jgi:hypothetical protein